MKRTTAFLLSVTLLLALLAGCAANEGTPVTVQSVAAITGAGSIGVIDRFAGVVSARSEVKLMKEENRTVSEVFVAAGEEVREGQVLFAYDVEESKLALEKAELEQQKTEDAIASLEKNKAELETQLEKAKESEKLGYTLEIQTAETDIREAKYNLALQQKQVARLEAAVEGYEIKSPIDGKIQTVSREGGTDNQGNPLPVISIMEKGAYRVKGYVNETAAGALTEGMPVLIRSRVHRDQVWTGVIAGVDWENPIQNQGNMYYDMGKGSDTASASRYPFYVELDSDEGLLLGQHVYIEPDLGQNEERAGLNLPSYYLFDVDGDSASVWVRGGGERLEKRTVTLGEYDQDLDTYLVTDGLTTGDYIAFPAEDCRPGAPTALFDESAFENADFYGGEEYDESYGGEEFYGEEFGEGAVFEGAGMPDIGEALPEAAEDDGGTIG